MKKELLSSAQAVELALQLSKTDFITENLAAAIGSSACGKRTFAITDLSKEYSLMKKAACMRLPIVSVNSSKDFFLNSGWLVFSCESVQEILDTVFLTFRVAEDEKVLLPALINIDNIDMCTETVSVPTPKNIEGFLGKYNAPQSLKNEVTLGTAIEYEDILQMHKSHLNALEVIASASMEFEKITGRHYHLMDVYNPEAEIIFVTYGDVASNAKAAVMKLKREGHSVGLVRLRVLRPFPRIKLYNLLKNAKAVAVIDKILVPGFGGMLYPEVKASLYETDTEVSNFIVSDNPVDFNKIYHKTKADLNIVKEKIWFI